MSKPLKEGFSNSGEQPESDLDIFKQLESTMVTHRQLMTVEVQECGEPMVRLNKDRINNLYLPQRSDMTELFGDSILVRKSVQQKLEEANALVKRNRPDLNLLVTYGYRTLEIQTQRFLQQLQKTSATRFYEDPYELYEDVHRFVAVPTTDGHTTGGAVDVALQTSATGEIIDFGSEIYSYTTKDCYVFSPNVTDEQKANRILLRKCMASAGFAPFDGEWWHFSYGDKEWAFYYKQPAAIYEQKKAQEALNS